ncbi:endonuclease III domain-containing protein [Staphylococcus simiae]|uniref:endonuclease III domain-containing protein n=1 Tax=Staphylococcus simiae TaxID=308354 RepID=UPI001A96E399|nr:endonuclease III domain-containing protein [Staphylococcus simiae]MBO1199585.1 endonuclease III domain-containing protein [Staphylococcus simiae]MBO1201619.1 endonuclease III domain-containing protein [Staphylococcus simiae]MBO1203739.1 endonuclease III domain-containing protein [Staphylococcus simiae]MBO1211612.1 endonuclease III domain-containing protein [Staphylococcus simiae]MBO1229998.1 endonuclease III domain-containing protein [Staphylococcus simiae]
MLTPNQLYQVLYDNMGPQYWWPASNNIEMMLGAILVQNTRWNNAAMALQQLQQQTEFMPENILKLTHSELQTLIRSSGFYKSKAATIINLLTWLAEHHFNYDNINKFYGEQLRQQLLAIKGIGSETADVLLVYIFKRVEFIPDNYTRRIFYKLGYSNTVNYDKFKREIVLPQDFNHQDANEFHALLDHFGKCYFNDKDMEHCGFLQPYFIR